MSLVPGTTLGPYNIRGLLGAGGMGTVYRARDERLQRDVALKVLPLGTLSDDQSRQRFRKEALALARLSHPNIAAVYDVGQQDGMDFLVMELVPGQSLADRLAHGPLPTTEALEIAAQIGAALQEAHEHGVVHRDLKPANIVITPKGTAKVLDFGIAKLAAPETESVNAALTATGHLMGTPLYMSPEQAYGEPVDARTDLWSLGVILYELLAGRRPFEGSTLPALAASMNQPVRPPREFRPDASGVADAVLARALTRDVAQRYQSAEEMTRDVTSVLSSMSSPRPVQVRKLPLRGLMVGSVIALLVFAAAGWAYAQSVHRRWATFEAVPAADELLAHDLPLAAYRLLERAAAYVPTDSILAGKIAHLTDTISINSSPSGATISVQDYLAPDSAWHSLGTTPLNGVRVPSGYFRWKIEKPGVGEFVVAPRTRPGMWFPLDSMLQAPAGMVRVGAVRWRDMIAFVGWVGPYDLPTFYLDRFEVTNREYQAFVDSGGYSNRSYWQEKFRQDGKELSFEDAMALFRDRSGRPGPSTWSGGHYSDGQAMYPVSGVSWFEAMAYARFAHKDLPTFAQWFWAAPDDIASLLVRESNINRKELAPVGSFRGISPFGSYDMAGNVREWALNALDADRRFIVGGAWRSQSYLAADPEALSAFDRSPENGIRCVRNVTPLTDDVTRAIVPLERDFSKVAPASDAVFNAYRALYSYNRGPLNGKVEGVVEETSDWRREKVSYDAAYGDERITAYLFLPRNVRPPYQTVIFFPSAGVNRFVDSKTLGDVDNFDFIVQSGRAVIYPVYKDTYERGVHRAPRAGQPLQVTTQRSLDVQRSLDYLATRADIDMDRLAYLGVSMGAAEGAIYATLAQDRLKTVLFYDGGYFLDKPPTGGDQADFVPRLKLPVLMVNGRFDFTFSFERSQRPFFEMLGTPRADKRHVLLETSHGVIAEHAEVAKVVLPWLEKYLGRVN